MTEHKMLRLALREPAPSHQMTRKRGHISYKTKLAAALRELAKIPRDHAEQMTEDQILSLFQWNHIVYHADTANDAHYNLDPLLIRAHRKRTAEIDVPQIAKTKRISATQAEFRQRLLTPRDQRPPKQSRWGSRPFQKREKRR